MTKEQESKKTTKQASFAKASDAKESKVKEDKKDDKILDTKKVVKKATKSSDTKKEVKKKESKKTIKQESKKEKEVVVKKQVAVDDKKVDKKSEYLYAVGRRKTSVAQVRVFKKGTGEIVINEKKLDVFFKTSVLQEKLVDALKVVGQKDKLDVSIKVLGGGFNSQAEAARHGIARALIQLNPNFRKPLKKSGYLTRDPRRKERKKPGLKRARKAPQWKKR
jgi:small subunit ribosomal protein S9